MSMTNDEKTEISQRSNELYEMILADPTVCAALERWRATKNQSPPPPLPQERLELVTDWMAAEA
jgi:hypothetical protein